MESNLLHFTITKVDGTTITQDLKCPTDMAEAFINQTLIQYSQVGVLKKSESGTRIVLTPASQIALVECEVSSLIIATEGETEKVAQAAEMVAGLRRIK